MRGIAALGAPRRPLAAWALVAATALVVGLPSVACAGGHRSGSTTTTTPTTGSCPTGARTVAVSSASQLSSALSHARPGDVIHLANGTYSGHFTATVAGTASAHITICGSSDAVLDGGTLLHDYTLYLKGANYTDVKGITVVHGLKGIMTDHWSHGTISGVTVHDIGEEGIHLREFSSYDTVAGSHVYNTGAAAGQITNAAHDGEGVYVGSAYTNWSTYTGGQPDASSYDVISGNTIDHTTAESVDIKEGTVGGTVANNHFDGTGMDPAAADSWVDVKGNNYTVTGNVGVNSPEDGFQTHVQLDGWGNGTTFQGNTADVNGPGYGFRIKTGSVNTVSCANTVQSAGQGFANQPCSA
jgi:hypothetical protein